jgi:hypothetical protein
MPVEDCFNAYVSQTTRMEVKALQDRYEHIDGKQYPEEKKEAYLQLLNNLPAGFELTAGMTTNYRCLKNIYEQRRYHRLPDWHVVCGWIETLPMAHELICGDASD